MSGLLPATAREKSLARSNEAWWYGQSKNASWQTLLVAIEDKADGKNAESKNLRENCNAKIDTAIHLVDALWNLILWGSHLAGGQWGGGRQRSRDSPICFVFNLQEKTPLILAMIGIITIIMAITSNQGWNYMMRSSPMKPSDGGLPYPDMGEHWALVLQFEAMYPGRSLQLCTNPM